MNVRIDKWLWAARFFKTRAMAKTAIDQGRIKINGQKCKPSRNLEIDDCVAIEKSGLGWEVMVLALSNTRGPAKIAQTLYQETDESVKQRETQAHIRKIEYQTTPRTKSKPSKKQRRELNRFKNNNETL